jgi:hypothetical protein
MVEQGARHAIGIGRFLPGGECFVELEVDRALGQRGHGFDVACRTHDDARHAFQPSAVDARIEQRAVDAVVKQNVRAYAGREIRMGEGVF